MHYNFNPWLRMNYLKFRRKCENIWIKISFGVYYITIRYSAFCCIPMDQSKFEPPHDKTNKMSVHPGKTQISLGFCPVWSESSLSAWRKLGSSTINWVHSEDSDQTGWMPRLIWVFAGRTCHFVGFCHVAAHLYSVSLQALKSTLGATNI